MPPLLFKILASMDVMGLKSLFSLYPKCKEAKQSPFLYLMSDLYREMVLKK